MIVLDKKYKMPYGFIGLNNTEWSDHCVDEYNKMSSEIHMFLIHYKKLGCSEADIERKLKWLKDARNRYYKIVCGIMK